MMRENPKTSLRMSAVDFLDEAMSTTQKAAAKK
jgi:hypothetical protein